MPQPSDWRRASGWLCFLLLVLLLLLATQNAHGQTPSESTPQTLSSSYSEAEQTLTLLLSRLAERKLQVLALQDSLKQADVRLNDYAEALTRFAAQLREAQTSLEKSRSDLTETSSLLLELSKRYDDLEADWQAYRSEMVAQVTGLEGDLRCARRWAVGFGVSTVAALVACIVFAIK